MEVKYNGRVLIPGIEYLVDPASPSIDFHGKVQYVGIKSLDSNTHYDHWGSKIHSAVIDTFTSKYYSDAAINLKQYTSDQRNLLLVKLSNEKLTWSCSQKQSKVPVITLKSEVFNRNETANFEIQIKNKLNVLNMNFK